MWEKRMKKWRERERECVRGRKRHTLQNKLYFHRVNIVAWEIITMFFHFRKTLSPPIFTQFAYECQWVCECMWCYHWVLNTSMRTSFIEAILLPPLMWCVSSALSLSHSLFHLNFLFSFLCWFHSCCYLFLLWNTLWLLFLFSHLFVH